jgi:outer membrane protein assembly factor BamB
LPAPNAALTASEDGVFVQEAPGRLSCLDLDGRRQWTSQVGSLRQELDASTQILVAVTENPPALMAIDAASGQSLWTCPLSCPATTPPAVRGQSICFADATGVQFRSLVDGRDLGRVAEDVSGPLYVGPGRYAFISRSGELVLGDPSDGRVVARVSGAVSSTNPLVAFNAVLFCTPTGIHAVDLQGREVRPYADLGPTTITAPPVLHAGRIYLGLAGRGLVCLAGDEVP